VRLTSAIPPDNRLAFLTDEAGATIGAYGYDPFGRRLFKEVNGARTYFLYNDEGLVGEYSATGAELRTCGYHPGAPWSTNPLFVQEGGIYYVSAQQTPSFFIPPPMLCCAELFQGGAYGAEQAIRQRCKTQLLG
jgi:hypothetical protein